MTHDNYGCGRPDMFAALEARRVAEPDSRDLEEIEVVLMKPADIAEASRQGQVEVLGAVATILLATSRLFAGSSRITGEEPEDMPRESSSIVHDPNLTVRG